MGAQKQKFNIKSKYNISLSKIDYSLDNPNYLGKLSCQSLFGLEYNIYNNGVKYSKVQNNSNNIRTQLGYIGYVYFNSLKIEFKYIRE